MLLFSSGLHAQITIGEGEEPVDGALLQLKDKPNVTGKSVNATKGLGMPRVELTSETDLFPMYPNDATYTAVKATEDPKHAGLMVYNLSTTAPFTEGVYIWNGAKWLPVGSGGGGGTSDTFWYGVGTTAAHTSNTDPSYLDAEVVIGGTDIATVNGKDASLSVYGDGAYIEGQIWLTGKATVGSATATRTGSLLDLKENNTAGKVVNATKGLGMPRVNLTSETDLFPMYTSNGSGGYTGATKSTEDPKHAGLLVYNLNDSNPFVEGLYIWDGEKWQQAGTGIAGPYCPSPKIASPLSDVTINCYDDNKVTLIVELLPNISQDNPDYSWFDENDNPVALAYGSGNYQFVVDKDIHDGKSFYCKITNDCGKSVTSYKFTLNVLDNPIILPPGYEIGASFTGRTCFDINRSNFGDFCGLEALRITTAVNFKILGGVPYTFTAPTTGTVQNLRFVVVDEEGCVSSYDAGDIPGTMANSSTSTLTVFYKTTLNDDNSSPLIVGRTSDTAAKVHLYAIYNYNGTDVSIPLTATIQDCTCCMGVPALQSEYVQLKQFPGSDVSPAAGNFVATGQNICIAREDSSTKATWGGAMGACQSGILGDSSIGWRLPNLAELLLMLALGNDLETTLGAAPGTTNMNTGNYMYWSASENQASQAWVSRGSDGYTSGASKTTSSYGYRCVKTY
ncbi:hypothetical protein D0T84_05390 [Dysgonomonas sp. 521]|nr:hypothetical protein [Dysgonomonas sp. 521]